MIDNDISGIFNGYCIVFFIVFFWFKMYVMNNNLVSFNVCGSIGNYNFVRRSLVCNCDVVMFYF